jgi:hypothetical protein
MDKIQHHIRKVRAYLEKVKEHIVLLEYHLEFGDAPYVFFRGEDTA